MPAVENRRKGSGAAVASVLMALSWIPLVPPPAGIPGGPRAAGKGGPEQQEPFEPKYKEIVSLAVGRAVEEAVQEMPRGKFGKILILPLDGDAYELGGTALRRALEGTGRFQEVRRSTLEEWLEWLGVQKPLADLSTAKDAAAAAREAGAEYALFGRMRIDPSRLPDRADVELHFRIVSAEGGGVFIGSFRSRDEAGFFSIAHRRLWIQEQSVGGRIAVWLVGAALLPLALLLVRGLFTGERPMVPAVLTALVTALDLFFAFVLMGFEIGGVVPAVVFLGAAAVGLAWNSFVFRRLAKGMYGTE